MKMTLTLASMILLTSLSSQAYGNRLHCAGPLFPSSQETIEIEAQTFGSDRIHEVTAAVTSVDRTEIGRKDFLIPDANYKPKKYVGSVRFDLSNLINTQSFGAFRPFGDCQILLHLPKNLSKETPTFSAPVLVHCEQAGGSSTLQCTYQ